MLDEAIHSISGAFERMRTWIEYDGEDRLAYYYAEGGLYVIKDQYTGTYSFIKAGSAKNALRIYKFKMAEGKRTEESGTTNPHWERVYDTTDGAYACSECGNIWWLDEGTPRDNEMHYCPKCGSRMADFVESEAEEEE